MVKEQLVAYFSAEKQGALILLALAVVALTAAVALVATRSSACTTGRG